MQRPNLGKHVTMEYSPADNNFTSLHFYSMFVLGIDLSMNMETILYLINIWEFFYGTLFCNTSK